MTEIHRVPLQPIARGALTKLWLALIAIVLVGGLLAWRALPAHVKVTTLAAGSGASPTVDDVVMVRMKGTLDNGRIFQPEGQGALQMDGVIPGFTRALEQMQKGGKYKVVIPSELGYGQRDQRDPQTGEVVIPGGSDLHFDIDLIDFKSRAEIEAQQRMMQQLQQQMQGKGAPGAPAAPGGADAVPGGPAGN